jgi:malate dehydrogenase
MSTAPLTVGDGEQWVASVLLDGEYGLHDVAIGVPVTLDRAGVVAIQAWQLDDAARRQLAPEL